MNETLKTIYSLRSIHRNKFSSKKIKDEDLKNILNACVRAANSSNRQSYSIVVVEDKKVMRKLCGYSGSKFLLFCVDFNRILDTAAHMNYSFHVDWSESFVTGSTDTILAAQTAAITAKSIGIDSLFTNHIHLGDISRVYKLLDLPKKYCFPLIALVLGYPEEEPDYHKGRLNGPGVIHYDTYKRLTGEELDKIVDQHDDPSVGFGLSSVLNWKYKGFKHYLDWYYGEWVPRMNKKGQVLEVLKKNGFISTN